MGAALGDFIDHIDRDSVTGEVFLSAPRGDDFEAEGGQVFGKCNGCVFIALAHRDEGSALLRLYSARTQLRFGEGAREVYIQPHHFAGGFHFRA